MSHGARVARVPGVLTGEAAGLHRVNVHVVPHTVLLLSQPSEVLQQSGQQLRCLVILLDQSTHLVVNILGETVGGIVAGVVMVVMGCAFQRPGWIRPCRLPSACAVRRLSQS